MTTLQQPATDIQTSGIGSPSIMVVGETVRYATVFVGAEVERKLAV